MSMFLNLVYNLLSKCNALKSSLGNDCLTGATRGLAEAKHCSF